MRWKLAANTLLFLFMLFLAIEHKTVIYLLHQGAGQYEMIMNTQSADEFIAMSRDSTAVRKVELVGAAHKYAEDSLGFTKTRNYTSVYVGQPKRMWVITASVKDSISPYMWSFPVVGKVSYKGFFDKGLALAEANRLKMAGYDVELRRAGAWSTLGWLRDPITPSMLSRDEGDLCNLVFHELFHSTYYARGEVDLNENLASFIAHKATLMFLRDSKMLGNYLDAVSREHQFDSLNNSLYMELNRFYGEQKGVLNELNRQKKIIQIAEKFRAFSKKKNDRFEHAYEYVKSSGNAYFIGFRQYDLYQDSLEKVFNKIYRGDLKNLVRHLKYL